MASSDVKGGVAGIGCLASVIVFFVALLGGAGILGSVGIGLFFVLLTALALGTLS